jgi:hypothetical protein
MAPLSTREELFRCVGVRSDEVERDVRFVAHDPTVVARADVKEIPGRISTYSPSAILTAARPE